MSGLGEAIEQLLALVFIGIPVLIGCGIIFGALLALVF